MVTLTRCFVFCSQTKFTLFFPLFSFILTGSEVKKKSRGDNKDNSEINKFMLFANPYEKPSNKESRKKSFFLWSGHQEVNAWSLGKNYFFWSSKKKSPKMWPLSSRRGGGGLRGRATKERTLFLCGFPKISLVLAISLSFKTCYWSLILHDFYNNLDLIRELTRRRKM